MMSNRCNTPLLIDPEETIELVSCYASMNSVCAAERIVKAWWAKHEYSEVNRLFLLSAIFEAGRIHVIREERRHRAHYTHKKNGGNHHE
ncbi:MAG: hypothetical protein IJL52_08200 [Clostridia bacterium]|nr:hypothetical protein [Clostridia bacterium]